MRYATAGAFRTALEQRLLVAAKRSEVALVLLRKLVAFERLLARLLIVAPGRWLLKGAIAFHFRSVDRFRATKDMDLGRWDNQRAATDDLVAAQQVDLNDHFGFAVMSTSRFERIPEFAVARYHISAYLAGRRFEELTVDVGFGDPPIWEPERLQAPDFLGFAEIAPIEVPVLPLEQQLAEKVHAYSRNYTGGLPSTRTKDLIDLVLIASRFSFQAGRLRSALGDVFGARKNNIPPVTLPLPPPGWGPAYRKLAIEVGLEPEVSTGYRHAAAFLAPVLAGSVGGAVWWDPNRQIWQPVAEEELHPS